MERARLEHSDEGKLDERLEAAMAQLDSRLCPSAPCLCSQNLETCLARTGRVNTAEAGCYRFIIIHGNVLDEKDALRHLQLTLCNGCHWM